MYIQDFQEMLKTCITFLYNWAGGRFSQRAKLLETACYVSQSGCVPEHGPHRETCGNNHGKTCGWKSLFEITLSEWDSTSNTGVCVVL